MRASGSPHDQAHSDHPEPTIPHRGGMVKVEGYGVVLELSSERKAEPGELEQMTREVVTNIAMDCMSRGARAIGHIKSHLKTPLGYVNADVVRLEQGAYSESNLKTPAGKGILVLNSIVLGLPREEIREITISKAIEVLKKHGFLAIEEASPGG